MRLRRFLRAQRLWPLAFAMLVLVAAVGGVALGEQGDRQTAVMIALALAVVAASASFDLARSLGAASSRALRDALTGLPNRTLLDDRLEQAVRQARRSGQHFALIAIDLDGFKDVNDVHGHVAGDRVLEAIARRLEAVVREGDTVARTGGDEFVVLSLDTGTSEEAAELAARLRHSLRRPFQNGVGFVEVDASLGWAMFPADSETPEGLLAHADNHMYTSKRDAVETTGVRRAIDTSVVSELEGAIKADELVIHYQPLVDPRSGATRRLEALVRRVHPSRGLLPPLEFLPHVERTPAIRPLTLHVVRRALDDLTTLQSHGHDLGVSVNLSFRSLEDEQLLSGIADLLAAAALEPRLLTVEVSASGPGDGTHLDLGALDALRALGVRLSLDDFGRGSSLAAAAWLPIDEVKVDGNFVTRLGHPGRTTLIAETLVGLAARLEVATVAESIETESALQAVRRMGFDLAQGFHLATPQPFATTAAWLAGGLEAA